MSAGFTAVLDRLAAGIASFFETTRPSSGPRQAWEIPVLLALLAIGAFLRFWGVGSWGLENDEETMAMPVMHILKDGWPVLPSGMFYARGIAQLYMMAGSVSLFGADEWSLRLPSVICGVVFIALTYLYGRRFLSPSWNMALVAIAAFLPGYIADSQEARMYIFMLACLAGFTALIFEWEGSGKVRHLVGAVLVMLVGLQFHVLTVFGAFLVFYPGLLQGSRNKFLQGLAAFTVIVAGYFLISKWVSSFYPPHPPMHGIDVVLDEHGDGFSKVRIPVWLLIAGGLGAMALAYFSGIGARSKAASGWIALLVLAGCGALLVFYDHIGILLLVAASIVTIRTTDVRAWIKVAGLLVFVAVVLGLQFISLHHAGVPGARKIIGAMIGLPSVWPILRMSQYSVVASLISFVGVGAALWNLAHARKIEDFWLYFALSAWLPLLLLGVFSWNVEARYTEFALLPVTVCALAAVQRWMQGAGRLSWVALLSVTALAINPLATARVVNAGYSIHPDHKGAAEFIRAVAPHPHDIVIAEDVNQQTYYLGRVDFWLISQDIADTFSELVDGRLLDNYTHTPILGSGRELLDLVARSDRGAIYVIGSGEDQQDGRRLSRAHGIFEALQQPEFKVVYQGRDGLTKVWKVDSPATATAASPDLRK